MWVHTPDFEVECVETKYYSGVFVYFIGLQPFNKCMFYGGTSSFLILFRCLLNVSCSLCGLIWAADIGNSPPWSPGILSYS